MVKSKASPMFCDVYGTVYSGFGWMVDPSPYQTTEALKLWLISKFNQAIQLFEYNTNSLNITSEYVGMSVLDESQDYDQGLIGMSRHKMVRHTKDLIIYPGWTFSSIDSNGSLVTKGYMKFNPFAVSRTSILNPTGSYRDIYKKFAQSRAAHVLVPRIKQEMQLAVSLLELPEMVALARLLPSFLKGWKQFKRFYTTVDQSYGANKTLRSSVLLTGDSAASANLTWQLALAPFINDVTTLSDLLKTISGKYIDLCGRYNGDKEHNHHYTEYLHSEDNLVRSLTQWNKGTSVGSKFSVKFHAQLSFRLVGPPDWNTFQKATYGLKLNWSELWESVPLSFLVDYVLKIGRAIEMLDHTAELTHLKTDYLESIRAEWTCGTHGNNDIHLNVLLPVPTHMGRTPYSQNRLLSGYLKTYYLRQPTQPYNGIVVPKTRVPNLKQSLVALSLLWVGLR